MRYSEFEALKNYKNSHRTLSVMYYANFVKTPVAGSRSFGPGEAEELERACERARDIKTPFNFFYPSRERQINISQQAAMNLRTEHVGELYDSLISIVNELESSEAIERREHAISYSFEEIHQHLHTILVTKLRLFGQFWPEPEEELKSVIQPAISKVIELLSNHGDFSHIQSSFYVLESLEILNKNGISISTSQIRLNEQG